MTPLGIVQNVHSSALKVLEAPKAATGQEAALQGAQAPLALVAPRAVLGGAMKAMTVAGSAQKRPALPPFFALVRGKGHRAPLRDSAPDVQAPVGLQVVQAPGVPVQAGAVLGRGGEMGHKIGGRARGPEGPGHRASGHGQRLDQGARAMAQGLLLAALAPTRLRRPGGGFALQHLHAGWCITAAAQAAVRVGLKRFDVQLTQGVGLGIHGFIVAVPPVGTRMGLEIDRGQATPAAGTAERVAGQRCAHGGRDGLQGPAGARARLLVG